MCRVFLHHHYIIMCRLSHFIQIIIITCQKHGVIVFFTSFSQSQAPGTTSFRFLVTDHITITCQAKHHHNNWLTTTVNTHHFLSLITTINRHASHKLILYIFYMLLHHMLLTTPSALMSTQTQRPH